MRHPTLPNHNQPPTLLQLFQARKFNISPTGLYLPIQQIIGLGQYNLYPCLVICNPTEIGNKEERTSKNLFDTKKQLKVVSGLFNANLFLFYIMELICIEKDEVYGLIKFHYICVRS